MALQDVEQSTILPAAADAGWGSFRVVSRVALVAGSQAELELIYTAGERGLAAGSQLRFGIPNTGWDRPVTPQQRYWDELVNGADRRLAPFHPVNTTAALASANAVAPANKAVVALDVMERMLVPDEDPALAYWRWWITATIEGADLAAGDRVTVLYGDQRFGVATRIQTFPEERINASAYVKPAGGAGFENLTGSPYYLDVITGPASWANVVGPSVVGAPVAAGSPVAGSSVAGSPVASAGRTVRIALTDECQGRPDSGGDHALLWDGAAVTVSAGKPLTIELKDGAGVLSDADGRVWGAVNPAAPPARDGLQLYWGDLHAQSEHHVMHSQRKDFRQEGWSKGISCGTLDECYQYAREVSLLDFVAMTDQGACLTNKWEYCQGKVIEYNRPGSFLVLKGYEAGSPLGHRNVIFSSTEVEAPLDAKRFNSFHPDVVFEHYRGRGDVIIIPHHVKTWTDWTYHDPELEPLMEIYSCWGQSESPGLDLWNKGQTPGAGAWEAFRRGYRMGLIASSDNHVGMPGRSYPGDRQIHTPFPGGLCAVWATELTAEAVFAALRARRCYGTTGARIVLRFSIGDVAMGGTGTASEGLTGRVQVAGTAELDRVELVRDCQLWRTLACAGDRLETAFEIPAEPGVYYLRLFQKDGQRAWSSPIWME
ncbi:MAG: CehA/McbA family metallohydrolase [Acidobacteriota bacterium]